MKINGLTLAALIASRPGVTRSSVPAITPWTGGEHRIEPAREAECAGG
jgi:hypothetical protein